MRKRKVIIEFKTPAGDKRLDGIEVKFSVEKLMSAVMNKASIDICNLSSKDIEYLTTYTSEFIAINERKRIRLFAGYDDSVALIFDGDIVEAKPTAPPDKWLRCKALSGYYANKDVVSRSMIGDVSIQEVFADASNVLGLSLNYESSESKKISNFSFTGDKRKIIKELSQLGNIDVFEDDGVLNVLDKGQPKKGFTRYISESSGLIGVPRPDPIGIELDLLLDNSLEIGQKVYLNSLTYPSCNGEYYIYELKHAGDLRGTEFYTTIKARRFNSVSF